MDPAWSNPEVARFCRRGRATWQPSNAVAHAGVGGVDGHDMSRADVSTTITEKPAVVVANNLAGRPWIENGPGAAAFRRSQAVAWRFSAGLSRLGRAMSRPASRGLASIASCTMLYILFATVAKRTTANCCSSSILGGGDCVDDCRGASGAPTTVTPARLRVWCSYCCNAQQKLTPMSQNYEQYQSLNWRPVGDQNSTTPH
jgi:hypothetical protein